MADDLSDEERDLIAKHRAAAKRAHKVRIRGNDEKSGAEYEFEIDDERADRIVSRHSSLWDDDDDDQDDDDAPAKGGKAKADPKVVPAHFGRTRRSS